MLCGYFHCSMRTTDKLFCLTEGGTYAIHPLIYWHESVCTEKRATLTETLNWFHCQTLRRESFNIQLDTICDKSYQEMETTCVYISNTCIFLPKLTFCFEWKLFVWRLCEVWPPYVTQLPKTRFRQTQRDERGISSIYIYTYTQIESDKLFSFHTDQQLKRQWIKNGDMGPCFNVKYHIYTTAMRSFHLTSEILWVTLRHIVLEHVCEVFKQFTQTQNLVWSPLALDQAFSI